MISPKIESYEPLGLEIADFVGAVRAGERMEYHTTIARSVVRLVEAADRSLRAGGREIAVEQETMSADHFMASRGLAVQ